MNAKKKFRLQKVLEVRELVEKNRQRDLGEAKQNLKNGNEELQQLENKRHRFTQNMNAVQKAEVNQFRGNQAYLETLNQAATEKHQAIAILEEHVETKRQSLLEASQNRKVLETLKEKKEAELIKEQNREEQDFIDEIASQQNRQL